MKRSSLLQHLRKHGCQLKREGASHSLWTNPNTGAVEAIPRHNEISNVLAGRSVAGFQSPRSVSRNSRCLTIPAHLRRRASAQPAVNATDAGTGRATTWPCALPMNGTAFTAG